MNRAEHFSHWILLFVFGFLNKYVIALSGESSLVQHPSYRQNYILRSWSDWTPWSVCSRTCGGGVRLRTRVCKIRMIRYVVSPNTCIGETVEYEICSQHNCSPYEEEFRSYQCSQHNGQVIAGRKIAEWIPYRNGKNPCELQCRSSDNSFVYSFGKVADGTNCPSTDSLELSLCINGRCMPVDCAGYIGKDNNRDMCGICRGNNSTCTKYQNTSLKRARIKTIYNDIKDYHYDYNGVTKIPAGATYIIVKDESENNFLVLVDHKGNYHINGNWRIQSPGLFFVQDSQFTYNRTWDGHEVISAKGPIKFDIFIYVLGSGDVPPVQYEYWISTNNQPKNYLNLHSLGPMKNSENIQAHINSESLNILIGPSYHSKNKNLTALKFQGYKSHYHHNEILKSVPSWSVKRHLNKKQSSNSNLISQNYSTYSSNISDNARTIISHLTNKEANDSSVFKDKNNSSIVSSTESSQKVDKNSNELAGLNETSAPTRNVENKSYTHTKIRVKSLSTNTSKRKDRGRRRSSNINSHKRGACSPCIKVKHQTKNFCRSEFVLRATILDKEKQLQSIRYEVEVIRSYKNKIHISSKEYLWTTDACWCPKLRIGKEYILMGYIGGNLRESKLLIGQNSFIARYNQKRSRTMLRLARDQNSTCQKYLS